MKNVLSVSIFAVLALVTACTSFKEEDAPSGLSLDRSDISLSSFEEERISVTVRSGDFWSVENKPDWIKVTSIDNSNSSLYEWVVSMSVSANTEYNREGVITFKSGTSSGSVSVIQSGKKGAYVAIESLTLDKTSLSMAVGETQALTATVTPSSAAILSLNWSSSNETVATVSSSGVVTAKAVGNTTVTVMTFDGQKTATCTVTVKAKTVSVTGVSLDKTSLAMTVGDTQTLVATVSPSNATDKSVTWSSSDRSIATVTTSGQVFAASAGAAIITVTTNDGSKTATCSVTVSQKKTVIQFADANVKQYLLPYYDTDHDNEISYEEAAAVTSIVSLNSVKTITSFDEFQYFTGVREVPDNWLKDCRHLKTVTLPPYISTIGSSAFENCEGLVNVDLSRDIRVGDLAFAGTSLSGTVSVYSIIGEAFRGTTVSDIYTYSSITSDYSNFDVCLQSLPEKTTIHIHEVVFNSMNSAVSFIASFSTMIADWISSLEGSISLMQERLKSIEQSLDNYRNVVFPAVLAGEMDKRALSGFPGLSLMIDDLQGSFSQFKASTSAQVASYTEQNVGLSPFFDSIMTEQSEAILEIESSLAGTIDQMNSRIEGVRSAYNSLFLSYEYLLSAQSNESPRVSAPTLSRSPLKVSGNQASASKVVELFNAHVVSLNLNVLLRCRTRYFKF